MDNDKWAGGLEILPAKTRKHLDGALQASDKVQFCLLGNFDQALVALQDRLIIVKPGLMAGAIGGARVTTFTYRDITGVEVNTGLVMGVIEVSTPSYQGSVEKDWWSKKKASDPAKINNCLPIAKGMLPAFKPHLDALRARISQVKAPGAAQARDLSGELQRLAAMRAQGLLSDAEFQQAKQKLLA